MASHSTGVVQKIRLQSAERERPVKLEPTFQHGGPGVDAFFTRATVLARIADDVRAVVEPDWTFVDFSCGTNEFAPSLGCAFYSFDASPAANKTNFTCADWFSVESQDFGAPDCEKLAIGLNPPFGYQGTLARSFVEYALTFRPNVLVLILPSLIRWSVSGYVMHMQRHLSKDSFYDPSTNKVCKEISAQFMILRKIDPRGSAGKTVTISKVKSAPKLPGVTLTRDWSRRSYPLLIIRRVGRHAGQQFYCATSDQKNAWAYVDRGTVARGTTFHGVHAVASDYFVKAYFDPSVVKNVTLDRLIGIATTMCENPEPGCEMRQPHAITNVYVRVMLRDWIE
jgi:hypothetical protein